LKCKVAKHSHLQHSTTHTIETLSIKLLEVG